MSAITLTEKINIIRAKRLLALEVAEIKLKFFEKTEIDKDNNKWSATSYIKSIKLLCSHAIRNGGKYKVKYSHGDGLQGGRYYGGTCIQSLQYKLRAFLLGDMPCRDVDIVNCLPSILSGICKKHDIECPQLNEYIKNRPKYISNGLTKLDFIKVLSSDAAPQKTKYAFYQLFKEEMVNIKASILDIASETEKIPVGFVLKEKNNDSRKVCEILKWYEADFLKKNIAIFGNKIIAIIHDGFIILDEDNTFDISSVWTPFETKVIVKPFDTSYTIEEVDDIDGIDTYEMVKAKFEKECFQILTPSIFMAKHAINGRHYQISIADLNHRYSRWRYDKLGATGYLRTPFIKDWLDDEKGLTYFNIDFIPYPNKIDDISDPRTFNTFTSFTNNFVETAQKTPEIKAGVSLIEQYFYQLCDNDEILVQYLIFLTAFIIQYPRGAKEIILLFKGLQGSGKDTLFRWWGKLIDKKYICVEGDIANVFGAFNPLLHEKLVLVCNEMKGSDGIKFMNNLKDIATRDNIMINNKNEKLIEAENNLLIVVASNQPNPLVVEISNRRIAVFKTGTDWVGEIPKWDKLNAVIENPDFVKYMFDYYKSLNLSDTDFNNGLDRKFLPKFFPHTTESKVMKERNIPLLFQFLMKYCVNWDKLKTDYGVSVGRKELTITISFADFKEAFDCWVSEKIMSDPTIFKPRHKDFHQNITNMVGIRVGNMDKLVDGERTQKKSIIINTKMLKMWLENKVFDDKLPSTTHINEKGEIIDGEMTDDIVDDIKEKEAKLFAKSV